MAELTIDALVLSASASTTGKVKRTMSSASAVSGTATVSNRLILIIKSDLDLQNLTSLNANSRQIKYIETAVSNGSSVQGISHKYKTINTELIAEATLEAFTYHRDIHLNMNAYLPQIYTDLEDVQTMIDAEASEVVRIQAKLSEVLDQFYVNSATYGLDRWEKEVGITAIPQRSTDSRRHYINAKLRGTGIVTAELMKNVVDAFYFAEITDNPSQYVVNVKLLGKRGNPKNLEDIDVAVTDIIPAHLQPEYEFTFATWGEMNDVLLTWQEADVLTMEELEETFYIDPGYPHEN